MVCAQNDHATFSSEHYKREQQRRGSHPFSAHSDCRSCSGVLGTAWPDCTAGTRVAKLDPLPRLFLPPSPSGSRRRPAQSRGESHTQDLDKKSHTAIIISTAALIRAHSRTAKLTRPDDFVVRHDHASDQKMEDPGLHQAPQRSKRVAARARDRREQVLRAVDVVLDRDDGGDHGDREQRHRAQ